MATIYMYDIILAIEISVSYDMIQNNIATWHDISMMGYDARMVYYCHETMVCAVCLTMFLWICDMTILLRGTFHVLVVFAPNLVPLSLGMQHYYFASYPTDDWQLANVFSPVYFSVAVCLRGLYHHSLLARARALHQCRCTPHASCPLTKRGGLISGFPF